MKKCSRQQLEGTTYYSPSQCYFGYNLINSLDNKTVRLLDMQGKTVKRWDTDYFPGTEGKLVSNGNLLYSGRDEDGPLADLEGAGGVLQELKPDNSVAWEYRDQYLHHRCHRLDNGNTLVLKWIKVPEKITAKVAGGFTDPQADSTMWGDTIQEITPEGKIAWEWKAHEHLDPENDKICPLCSRREWTHATSVEAFDDNSKILVSFMRIHTVVIIDKETGNIDWKWGPGQISHQNYATSGPDGNVLILDNGRHIEREALSYSRSILVDPENNTIVGGYEEDPPNYFCTSFLGNTQILPNGGTLLVEGTHGRAMEVDYRNGMVWEYVNPEWVESDQWGKHNYIVSMYRYGLENEGLRKCLDMKGTWRNWLEVATGEKTQQKTAAEKAPATMADAVRNRLANLGY